MRAIKLMKYGIIAIFFLWWFFLSHVTFTIGSFYVTDSKNNDFMVKYYYPAPINLFGLYFWVVSELPTYVVLYDKDNNYIGQSDPFCMPHSIGIYGSEYILPDISKGDEYYERFFISGEPFDGSYTIPVKEKKWWSKVLQYFH
ncbi:DUF6201 family protein [Xenorhabdus doucetiae]|uniref:Uncharacterized protein n=1 Tax=Xenorhabdus doucetiae TaxID=351671 RepID=A0A068QSY9_9GAMM|nr:DUF6201 family protein [Xenorhabdus doucetiae]TYP11651.1 hypothetical protein LY16_01010 [Xenorhabdus doucetiae]CDG17721.1 conserved protein of unknown function [Xenorhabdus doucetiae]